MPNRLFMNRFPKFWSVLEEELDVYDNDLNQIKSIFTALGFMTSTSIASIKTPKKLSGLESEYMKLRSNTKTFEELCSKLPALKGIDSFTSGIIATMMDVIIHLNPKKPMPRFLDEEAQKTLVKTSQMTILEQATKV